MVEKQVKASKAKKIDLEECFSGQNTYTLHKPVSKMFPRNPYTVININDILEVDRAELSSFSKYNDKFK